MKKELYVCLPKKIDVDNAIEVNGGCEIISRFQANKKKD